MRRLISLFSLSALSALLPAIAMAQAINVDPLTWDFGEMKQQETRSFTATITNTGAGLLRISEVKADCGCTVPEMAVKELPPGQSAPLKVEFNSKRFVGDVIKTVQIFSNDPRNPVADIILTAKVNTPLVVDPLNRRLGFVQSLEGDIAERRITLTALDIDDLQIKVRGTRHGMFDVKAVNHVDGDPRKAQVIVTKPARLGPGGHRDNVRIETNIPEMATVDVELKSDVFAPIKVQPERLSFRFQPRFKVNVRVQAFENREKFKITGVECDMPEIKIGDIVAADGGVYIIPVTGAPLASDDPRAVEAGGRMKGQIIVHTDLPKMSEITIPITYMIRM